MNEIENNERTVKKDNKRYVVDEEYIGRKKENRLHNRDRIKLNDREYDGWEENELYYDYNEWN